MEVENLAGFEGHFKTIVLYSTAHGSHFFLHMWVAVGSVENVQSVSVPAPIK